MDSTDVEKMFDLCLWTAIAASVLTSIMLTGFTVFFFFFAVRYEAKMKCVMQHLGAKWFCISDFG